MFHSLAVSTGEALNRQEGVLETLSEMSNAVIGIITARGGSKGIPGKNIKQLAGKPMIAWTIEAALKANCLSQLLVSTDDPEIARVAWDWGAKVPFLRPAALATDTASSVDVALHALSWLRDTGKIMPEFILLLQPTSPLRQAEDIQNAVKIQRDTGADAVVGVCVISHPVQWLMRLGAGGELLPWLPNERASRRQDTEPLYQVNGALYLIRTEVLQATRTFSPIGTQAYVMPPGRSLDIDTPWDFQIAELVLRDRPATRWTAPTQEIDR